MSTDVHWSGPQALLLSCVSKQPETSAKKVMFSLSSVCLFVCLFEQRLFTQKKTTQADFHKIRRKDGTEAEKETVRFQW